MGGTTNAPAGSDVTAADTGPMSVEVLRDWPSVEALQREWNPLLHRSRANTIFLTWEWIQTWIDISGRHAQPFVVIVRDSHGALVGIAPFYACKYRFLGVLTYRVLRVMGDWPTGAEYPDWIVDQAVEARVVRRIADALLENRKSWDCIWMPKLAGWTGVAERLAEFGRHARLHFQRREMYFGLLELPRTAREYEGQMSGDRRQQLRRKRKQFLARPAFTLAKCVDEAAVPGYLQALFELHALRWSTKGQLGVFRRKPDEARFYEQFAPLALRAGWLRLYGAMEGGSFKAVQLGYVYNRVFLQMQEGFDPAYAAGVGNVLRHHVIESCINEQLTGYDFLGEMSEHKGRWLAQRRTGYDIFMAHKGFKNLPLVALRCWPSGRFLRPLQLSGAAASAPSKSTVEPAHGV